MSKEPFGQEVLGLLVPTHDLEERVHLCWPHGLLVAWGWGGQEEEQSVGSKVQGPDR